MEQIKRMLTNPDMMQAAKTIVNVHISNLVELFESDPKFNVYIYTSMPQVKCAGFKNSAIGYIKEATYNRLLEKAILVENKFLGSTDTVSIKCGYDENNIVSSIKIDIDINQNVHVFVIAPERYPFGHMISKKEMDYNNKRSFGFIITDNGVDLENTVFKEIDYTIKTDIIK